ncbi:MAG: tol-pal system-associated acyl-CoA thioesterase [Alphaproteobacteria bacterium]|nr:tol-pal system-associated acyl-CoA thioesterase [Alphaproteobacteria bacterium]
MIHHSGQRVYFSDTDAGGIVYHSNYIVFAEHARSDMMRDLGYTSSACMRAGFAFVIRHVSVDFLAPARLDDDLDIRTRIVACRNASLTFEQTIFRGEELLARVMVKAACVNKDFKPIRFPEAFRARFAPYIETPENPISAP